MWRNLLPVSLSIGCWSVDILFPWRITYIWQCLRPFLGFPGSSAGKESTWNAGDPDLIHGLGRSPGEGIGCSLQYSWANNNIKTYWIHPIQNIPNFWASLTAQTVKNLPAMWETWVRSLGREDPLGEGMAIHSSILAWRIPWTEEPGRL